RVTTLALTLVGGLLAAPAAAAPLYAADDALGLVVGAKTGAGIGLGPLGITGLGELELGYTLPLPAPLNRDLQLFVGLQYAQPTTEGTADAADARLPGDGSMTYAITQRQFIITPGLLYR
ncbi:MAG: hypothetical protein KC613_27320, partial [Myxococcales bacterium]|nr:hypothetical protein [Myxococcales bacterium]